MKKNIWIWWGVIDIRINKEKIESYKTEMWRRNFLQKYLREIFDSLIWKTINWIELRHIEITSNHFWWSKETIINDIWYSCNNELPLNEKFVTYRFLHVDFIWVITDKLLWVENTNEAFFPTYIDDNYIIDICNYKRV